MDYYVLKKGASTAEGPYASESLREQFRNGAVTAGDMVAPVGATSGADWQPIEAVFGLSERTLSAPASGGASASPPPVPAAAPAAPQPSVSEKRSTPAPPLESSSAGKGCAIGCALVLGIGFALVVAGYIVLMHTAVPLRQFARALEQEEDVEIRGIDGSLATGVEIDQVLFPSVDGRRPEMNGVKVRYSGFWDLARGQIIFEEVSVSSARLFGKGPLRGWEALGSDDFELDDEITVDEGVVVRIKSLEIADVLYEDLSSGEETRFDLFRLKDFEARSAGLDLGEVTVQTDWLDLATVPAEPMELDGAVWRPARRYDGVVKPAGHAAIRREIPLTLALRANDFHHVQWYAGIFDQKWERYSVTAQRDVLRCEELDLNDWLNVDAVILPQIATLRLVSQRSAEGGDMQGVEVESGRFTLGQTTFDLEQGRHDPRSEEGIISRATISVNGEATDVALAMVDLPETGWRDGWECRLESDPPVNRRALLAAILFAKSPDALTEQDSVVLRMTEAFYFERTPSTRPPMNEVELPPLPPVEAF